MSNAKKKCGALATAVVFCLVMGRFLTFIFFAILNCREVRFLLAVYAVGIACAIIGTIVALILRFKEIDSGEEDEARKY